MRLSALLGESTLQHGAEYRLITIPPSHYCEKARWALDRAGISYREEGHPPLLHRLAVKLAGGDRSTPVLVAGKVVLPDSTDILQFIDVEHAEGWRPYPTDSQLRVEAEELEEIFDTRLGPHTRRIAYYHLLQHNELFLASVLAGVGGFERSALQGPRAADQKAHACRHANR